MLVTNLSTDSTVIPSQKIRCFWGLTSSHHHKLISWPLVHVDLGTANNTHFTSKEKHHKHENSKKHLPRQNHFKKHNTTFPKQPPYISFNSSLGFWSNTSRKLISKSCLRPEQTQPWNEPLKFEGFQIAFQRQRSNTNGSEHPPTLFLYIYIIIYIQYILQPPQKKMRKVDFDM